MYTVSFSHKFYSLLSVVLLLSSQSLSTIVLAAQSDVISAVQQIRTADPNLPLWIANPRGLVGQVIDNIFYWSGPKEGKIRPEYIDALSANPVQDLTNLFSQGTVGYLPKYTGTGANIGNSQIYDNGTNVGIGTASPGAKLDVNGQIKITGGSPWVNKVLTSDASGLASWGSVPYPCIPGGSGSNNTCYGIWVLSANTTGTYNIGIGYDSLYYNTTGSNNTAVGINSLNKNTTASSNTAYWAFSLNNNTTGYQNVAIGSMALNANTVAMANVGVGDSALLRNIASYNTAVGWQVMYFNTSGTQNIAMGSQALFSNTTGSDNSANWFIALTSNISGSRNTANGSLALFSNTTGNNNVAIGQNAGSNLTTGDNNLFIGYNTQPNISNTSSNQLNIGNWIYGDNGNIGIWTATPSYKLDVVGTINASALRLPNSAWAGKVLTSDAAGLASWSTLAIDAPVFKTTLYGDGWDIPARTSSLTPRSLGSVLGPISTYAPAACPAGTTRQHRLYARYTDDLTSGQSSTLRLNFGATNRDITLPFSNSNDTTSRDFLSPLFTESATNNANIQISVSNSSKFVQIYRLELWHYCF